MFKHATTHLLASLFLASALAGCGSHAPAAATKALRARTATTAKAVRGGPLHGSPAGSVFFDEKSYQEISYEAFRALVDKNGPEQAADGKKFKVVGLFNAIPEPNYGMQYDALLFQQDHADPLSDPNVPLFTKVFMSPTTASAWAQSSGSGQVVTFYFAFHQATACSQAADCARKHIRPTAFRLEDGTVISLGWG